MTVDQELSPLEIGAPLLVLDAVTTVADHVGFNIYMRDRPVAWRRRVAISAVALVGGPLVGLALGFLLAWATDPGRLPLGQLLGALRWADWRQGLGLAALVSGVLAAIAGLAHLARGPILAWRLRRRLAEWPGVDPADPERRSRLRVTLAERGLVVDGVGSHSVMAATSLRSADETAAGFMLMVGATVGFVVPKRDLSAEQQAGVRAITGGWLVARRDGADG